MTRLGLITPNKKKKNHKYHLKTPYLHAHNCPLKSRVKKTKIPLKD